MDKLRGLDLLEDSKDFSTWEEVESYTRVWTNKGISHLNALYRSGHYNEALVQESLLACTRYAKRGKHDLSKAYVRSTVRGIISRSVTAHKVKGDALDVWGVSSATIAGSVQYTKQREKLEEALGRELTPKEVADLAHDIRENWHDPVRKPSHGFHRELGKDTAPRLEAMEGFDIVGDEEQLDIFSDDNKEAKALVDSERSQEDMFLNLYPTLAKSRDLPDIQPGLMSPRRAQTCHELLGPRDGIERALEDWESGEDTAYTRAFFAPFGGNDAKESVKRGVVDLMKEHRAYAADIYASALARAS